MHELRRSPVTSLAGFVRWLPCFVVFAVACAAQDPLRDTDRLVLAVVTGKLESTEAADVAWGGYLANRYRLEPARDALLGALERWREVEGMEARVVRLHLVDGLIGARVNVPAEPLEFLLQDVLTRQGAFALMARQPRPNKDAILRAAMAPAEAFDPMREHAARVVTHFGLRSPAYAKFLLGNLQARFAVEVVDAESESQSWNSAEGWGGEFVPPALKQMRGFPPLVRLDLGSRASATEVLTIGVPIHGDDRLQISREEDVVYEKWELQRGKLEVAPDRRSLEGTLSRIVGSKVDSARYRRHEWVDAAGYLRIAEERDTMVAELDAVLAELRTRRWLAPEDLPGYRIPIEVVIEDRRGDRSTPLPVLPAIAKQAPK